MYNVIEAGPNVYQSLGVPLWDYNIISRSSHRNLCCKKGALVISSKILQKCLWLTRLLDCNLTKNELLHKSFQRFLLDYQKNLFSEQLFMGHSWQRVSDTLYVTKTPQCSLFHLFKILSNSSFLLRPTFIFTAFFDVLFLWLNGWSCHIQGAHLMCYFT